MYGDPENQRPLTPDLEVGGVALDAKDGLLINRPIKRYTEPELYMIRAALSPNYWPEELPRDMCRGPKHSVIGLELT